MHNLELLPTFWIDNPPYNWDTLGSGNEKKIKKGELVFLEGTKMEHIYLIKTGKIKLSITSNEGDEKTIGFIGKNSIVGTSSLFNNAQYMFNARSVTDTHLIKYDRLEFIEKVMEDKDLMMQIFKIMSIRIRILTNHTLDLAYNHSYKRLAKALLDISKIHGKKTRNNNVLIDFNITQKELGEVIGTTWVTVAHNIRKLCDEGIINREGKNYVITDYNKLELISG